MFTKKELEIIMAEIQDLEIIGKIDKILEEAKEYKLNLYSFYFECGRMGSLEGVFKANPEMVKVLEGKELYFGEVLGKHSEVYGPFESVDYSLVSDDPLVVMEADESGYNPFNYWKCPDCGDIINPKTQKCWDEDCGYDTRDEEN